ncbi:MAG TPA: class I SAM-dependent methyltransferase [Thermoanaerobaculia bacterium]|jgi:SAM-dependent methyltransferase
MTFWERLKRRLDPAAGPPPPPRLPDDYKAAWNEAALGAAGARDAVLTGSTPESFESTARSDADRIRKHLRAGDIVLNIGCGVGRVDLYLAPHVREIWAIDVSGEMLARARERLNAHGNVRFLEVGNRDFLSAIHTQSIDLVFSYLVLQHLEKEDAVKYLREAARVLKPGGFLVTQFPNYLSPEYARVLLQESDVAERSPGRVRPYTEAEVRQTLAVVGYEIVELHLEGGRDDDAEIYVVGTTPKP